MSEWGLEMKMLDMKCNGDKCIGNCDICHCRECSLNKSLDILNGICSKCLELQGICLGVNIDKKFYYKSSEFE